jgi:hypothetical protein
MMLPGALQYQGKLKERADVIFAWMELHQFTFHHPENWCSCNTDMVEKDSAPKWYTGKLLFETLKNIQDVFEKGTVKGQKRKKTPASTDMPFKKQSIILKYLSYWKDLETCHNNDLMHVTKNVLDNITGTLLDMLRKMKDGLKSCNDLVQFGLRPELHHILRPNGKHYLPSATYSLTVEEKKALC